MSGARPGPFFRVALDEGDPFIAEISAAECDTPQAMERRTLDQLKVASFASGSTAPILTREEVLALPNGQELIDEFMAGDTRRRDRQWLPETIAMLREEAVTFPDPPCARLADEHAVYLEQILEDS